MNKKLTLVVCVLISVLALGEDYSLTRTINFVEVKHQYVNPTPPITPLSIPCVEGVIFGDEMLISCQLDESEMRVIIVGNVGVVYDQITNLCREKEQLISITNWENGIYSMYVYVGDNLFVGEVVL